jgi:hypothetical protein
MKQQQSANRGARRRYVPRFAGEAFGHDGNPDEGPDLRRLVSTEAWKQPPSAKVRSEVAV